MKKFEESELILNPDGSVYHLNLHPEDISNDIILVGDPNRVARVSSFFDSIEVKKSKREIITHTGHYKGKRITVMSTGMGVGCIDIVVNELDALANIDLKNRVVKDSFTKLNLVRVGTSGSLVSDIDVDSFVVSEYALGLDGLMYFYNNDSIFEGEITKAFIDQTSWNENYPKPYVVRGGKALIDKMHSEKTTLGFTATAGGFYAPQGRVLRYDLGAKDIYDYFDKFNFDGNIVTNFEMESSAIYGLARMYGHDACSLNCIIANRVTKKFSKNPYESVDNMIKYALDRFVS